MSKSPLEMEKIDESRGPQKVHPSFPKVYIRLWVELIDIRITKFFFQINLVGEMQLMDTNASRPVDSNIIQQLPVSRGAQVNFNRLSPNMYYYWSLPRDFLGERVCILTCLLISHVDSQI